VTDSERPGEAVVRRSLDDTHNLLIARGNFASLFAGYIDHVVRWEKEPDGLARTMMRQGLAAGALHLACRPKQEMVGWTINLLRPPLNLFLTGNSEERTITGRAVDENVRTAGTSRMFVETSNPSGAVTQSTIEIEGFDVLGYFEQFYLRSEQKPARFFEVSDDEFVMLLGLPGTDVDALARMTREEGLRIADETRRALDERTFRFQCGCNYPTMRDVISGLFRENPEELFQGEEGVEVFCPRCGRRWWITRADLQGA
jgi:molecular chaperone Hsp33